jgi:hypothetical protein
VNEGTISELEIIWKNYLQNTLTVYWNNLKTKMEGKK